MKKAIIIHGMPSKEDYYNDATTTETHANWIPWVQKQLLLKDILAQAPEMPHPYEPVYQDWLETFKQFNLDADTILIGHSCGGGFLLRYLSVNNIKVGKVVLVAPWMDPEGEIGNNFFAFQLDPGLVAKTDGLTVFYSDNDEESITLTVNKLRETVPGVKYQEFHGYGHFCIDDMKSQEFPELLEEATK